MRANPFTMGLLALAFVCGACGSDDDEGGTDTRDTGADTTPDTTEDTAPDTAEDTAVDTSDTGPEETADTTPDEVDTGEKIIVAVLLDGTRGDGAFGDMAGAGIDRAAAEFDDMTILEPGDMSEALEAGAELIIGIGFGYQDAIGRAAIENPEVSFGLVDAVVEEGNVSSMLFAENEGSFLVGAAAGLMTQSNEIGFIGGAHFFAIYSFQAGFEAGVRHVNPFAQVTVDYLCEEGDFSCFGCPECGAASAGPMYAAAADVIFHAAGGAGFGVFQAALEHTEDTGNHVWTIGVDADQYNTVPADLQPHALTSMLKRVDNAVYSTIADYRAGAFQAGLRFLDLAVDGVGYSVTGGFIDDLVPQLEELKAAIITGEIQVPFERRPPSPFEVVVAFDPALGELPEGIALRDGITYVGMALTGAIVAVDADGVVTPYGSVPAPQPNLGFVTGLAFDADGALYVGLASFAEPPATGIYRIDAGGGEGTLYASHESLQLPNALAFDDGGDLLVTDSFGAIFRVSSEDGSMTEWLRDDLLKGSPAPDCGSTGLPLPIGANGIVFEGDSVALAVSDLGTMVRVPIEEDGSAGTPATIVGPDCRLFIIDGVASDGSGGFYVTVQGNHSVQHIDAEGTLTELGYGRPLDGPASLVVGAFGGGTKLLVTSFAIGTAGVGNPKPALVSFDL